MRIIPIVAAAFVLAACSAEAPTSGVPTDTGADGATAGNRVSFAVEGMT